MQEVERFITSKSGRTLDCEDAFTITADFACVVDGATSQTSRLWGGKTSGQKAAQIITETVERFPADINALSAIQTLTLAIANVYREQDFYEYAYNHPLERCTASVVLYSQHHKELWLLGDCQCLIVLRNSKTIPISNWKRIDQVIAAVRALYLESELFAGKNEKDLQRFDTGAEFIKPLLQRQGLFQNAHPESEYSYWVVDGFPVAGNEVKIVKVMEDATHLILASDGYPRLFPALEQTECFLREIIASDPLLISKYKSTKCIDEGNDSYDDRVYLKIRI